MLKQEQITVRKSSYDVLVACFKKLDDRFWDILESNEYGQSDALHHCLNHQQKTMVLCLSKQVIEHVSGIL